MTPTQRRFARPFVTQAGARLQDASGFRTMPSALATLVVALVFLEVPSGLPLAWKADPNENASHKRVEQLRGPAKSELTTQVRGTPSKSDCPRRLSLYHACLADLLDGKAGPSL